MPPDFDAIYRPEDYPSNPYNLMNYFRPPLERFGPRDIRGINEGGTAPVWVDRWGGGNSSAALGAPASAPAAPAPGPVDTYNPVTASADYQRSNPAFQPGLPDSSGITSARQRLMEIYGQQPKREDYKPSIWRTLGSALSGGAVAYAGGGRPQSVEEGMNIVRGGLDQPYNKAMSVYQPKLQAAQTGLQAAEQDYQLGRQRTMDQSTLEERAALARERSETADWRARQERKMDEAPPPTQQIQGPDRQTHIMGWNPITRRYDIDQGVAAKQPKEDTAQQRYEDAVASGNQTEAAKWLRVMETEARARRTGERQPGELTPAQIAREKNRLQDEYQKRLDSVEKLIREGEKTGEKDRRGQAITRKYDPNDPQIIEMKQRAQDDYERGLENIGQTPKRVTYQAGQPAPTPQGQQTWSKSAWAKANPGKDANAAETAARQQKLNVVP